jgi:hypothetical protein
VSESERERERGGGGGAVATIGKLGREERDKRRGWAQRELYSSRCTARACETQLLYEAKLKAVMKVGG